VRIFTSLYEKILKLAGHRHALWYLIILSFTEASFFPVPVDVLLAPMVIARRSAAWRYAAITTLASVAGGVLGYIIGMFAFPFAEPLLHDFGLWENFLKAQAWFSDWGFWALLIAGFLPIPYKVFTIAAGVLSMSLIPFIMASIIGRGGRFYLVTGVIVVGGEKMERLLHRYMDWIAWIVIVAVGIIFLVHRFA